MKRPRTPSSDQPNSSLPPPAPLCVGEHVLCSLISSNRQLSDAVVISLDHVYQAAAKKFERDQEKEQNRNGDPQSPSPSKPSPRINPSNSHLTHQSAKTTPEDSDLSDDAQIQPNNSSKSISYHGKAHPSSTRAYAKTFVKSESYSPSKKQVERDPESTFDIHNTETIDVDAEDSDQNSDVPTHSKPQSRNKILFKEAAQEKHDTKQSSPSKNKDKSYSKSPQNSSSANHILRRFLDPIMKDALMAKNAMKLTETPAPHPVKVGRVYVHFTGRDRRLDRWVKASELKRASASSVAAAASGVISNTLVQSRNSLDLQLTSIANQEGKLTRARRRAFEEINPISQRELGNEVVNEMERVREENTKIRNISHIVLGEYHVDAWYYSPYPDPFRRADTLYICGQCLKYVRTKRCYMRHRSRCTWIGPPGSIIYNDKKNSLRVYEVDGMINSAYCESLCLLGKLFLDHKTLYFDVAPFLFYIVTLDGEIAGFFSKEKPLIASKHNLACILTLPQHQRKGVGRFLISLSYELSKLEGKFGTPERPLSDLGQVSYRSYWNHSIICFLQKHRGSAGVSCKDIENSTGIVKDDIIDVLKSLKIISFWKGESFADTTVRAFEIAEKEIKEAQISLHIDTLKKGFGETSKTKETSKIPSVAGGPASNTRKRSRTSMEDDDVEVPAMDVNSQPSLNNVNDVHTPPSTAKPASCTQKLVVSRPKSVLNTPNPNIPGYGRAPITRVHFSPAQVNRMKSFIDKHGAARVRATLNSREGVTSYDVKQLALKIGVNMRRCRKKLRTLSDTYLSMQARRNAQRARTIARNYDEYSGNETDDSTGQGYLLVRTRRGQSSDGNHRNGIGDLPGGSLFDDLEIVGNQDDEEDDDDDDEEEEDDDDDDGMERLTRSRSHHHRRGTSGSDVEIVVLDQ